ncbi:hypothetical protein M8818_000481 [Zalaria obscura]|uniref:Uncharacterized protein n=1 Tax=Zalaria obscura TaxID=2024903 RepID=A0ACC3SNH5_9PEZI
MDENAVQNRILTMSTRCQAAIKSETGHISCQWELLVPEKLGLLSPICALPALFAQPLGCYCTTRSLSNPNCDMDRNQHGGEIIKPYPRIRIRIPKQTIIRKIGSPRFRALAQWNTEQKAQSKFERFEAIKTDQNMAAVFVVPKD